jgi:hypothetical protein
LLGTKGYVVVVFVVVFAGGGVLYYGEPFSQQQWSLLCLGH